MDTSKVFMVPDGVSGAKALDPNLLLSMMNNNGGFGGNGNWMWIIFLFFLYGWGGNGLFGRDGAAGAAVASSTERDMLLQAINGNGAAIGNLATTLNCDINSVKTAINSVQSAIQSVGNQVGLSGQQVINSIQQGNMQLASQLSQCCCDNKQLITTMGYEGLLRDLTNTCAITTRIGELANGVQTGFATTAYENAQQTCAIQNSLKDQTLTIIDKISNMEANAQQDKINTLTAQLTAANSRAERQAELAPIVAELNAIRSAQPSTTTVQYPQLTVIPSSIYNMLGGLSYNGSSTPGFWN